MLSGYRLQDRHLLLQDNHHHESQWAHIKSHMWAMRAPIIGKIQMEFSVSSNMRSDEVEFNVWVIRIHAIRKYSPTHIESYQSNRNKKKCWPSSETQIFILEIHYHLHSDWKSEEVRLKPLNHSQNPSYPASGHCVRTMCTFKVNAQTDLLRDQ